jgi:chemotaxis protein MotB
LTGRGPHILEHQSSGSNATPATKMIVGKKASEIAEQRLKSFINEHNLQTKVEINLEERGLVISVATDDLLFPRGSAVMAPRAGELLKRIIELLATVKNDVMVEGHTCSLPINTAQFPSNWELSSTRACSVLRYLQSTGISTQRLSAAGYADTRPRQLNNTEAHRARNRRVDIVLLTQSRWAGGALSPIKPISAQEDMDPKVLVRVRPDISKIKTPKVSPDAKPTVKEP